MQLPRHARRVRRSLFVAGLRVDAIGLDIFAQSDIVDGIRIGIDIGQMRPVARIWFDENDLGICFERGARGLCERIARFHWHIDCAIVVFWIRIKDYRHLRQARQRLQVDIFERAWQLYRHNLGPIAQNCAAHFGGEFKAAGNYREISEITPAQAGKIVRAGEHTAAPRPRAFREWPCASENARRFGWTR